jgi:monoamine oxidase
LTCFSGGPPAETCRSWKSDEREKNYLDTLAKMYPTVREHFVKSAFMDWPSEQLTGAGYSFPAPGQVTTMGPILYDGVGRLQFAGEHACYAFVGYMEGALLSGVSVARRMARRDGVVK